MDKLITDEQLQQAAAEGMDAFLKVFADAYLRRVDGELTAETMPRLTGSQHVLLGYSILHEELMDGGFCQLIQNGYGPYIFDNPFAKAMRLWGMRNECCGGYVAAEDRAQAQKRSGIVMQDALANGADTVITACPLCLYNLKKNGGTALPVVYFTELLAEALGVK